MMNRVITIVTFCLLLTAVSNAQTDNYGKTDTLYADVEKIGESSWTITISLTNDEYIGGMSVPLRMSAGTVKIVGDSAIYTGGRVDHFTMKLFRPDTAIQCITLGMVANLGPTNKTLTPGSGRLVTIYVSSLDGSPIEKLIVDTATTSPNNSLMLVAERIQLTDPPDTIPLGESKKQEIIPVFVVRTPK
ncbi:MAG: hypothetical protein IIA17_01105 [candidate division Zixibacteria bacterium]|nr:hypothetical protein [candidate division Zixibacteria bacterium]